MELIKAYQAMPSSGNVARIYEFRGRYHRRVTGTDKAGKTIRIVQRGKPRFVLVAAENLYDAVIHLHSRRPTFFLEVVMYRGELRLERQRLKSSDEKGSVVSEPGESTPDLPASLLS